MSKHTGRKDKRGVEIYEGDLILVGTVLDVSDSLAEPDMQFVQGIFEVVYKAPAFNLKKVKGGLRSCDLHDTRSSDLKVIGNDWNAEVWQPGLEPRTQSR